MKLFIEILKIIGISSTTSILLLFLVSSNHHYSCSALDAFDGSSSLQLFFSLVKTLLIAFVIWLAGFITYFLVKQKKRFNLFIYFSLLTVLSISPFVINAINKPKEKNRELKQVICNKSSDDGMQLNFSKLTNEEYLFINSKTNWLPPIPADTKSVDINYYRDDFLGDYSLSVEIQLNNNQPLDTTKFPKWKKSNKGYTYFRSQN